MICSFGMKLVFLVAVTSPCFVVSKRILIDDRDQVSSEGCSGNCNWAHIDPSSGYGCTTCKKLTGGQAADTRKVVLTTPGGMDVDAVVKYAGPSQEIDSLRTEIKVAKSLMAAHVPGVPHYFTQVVTNDGNPVLAMEWLDGYKDLEGYYPTLSSEDAFTRETRAAAMFHAYISLYMAGVRHCDLHWGQVMFKVDDPTDAKFIDFGKSQSGRTVEDAGCVSMGQLPDIGSEGKLWDGLYLGDKFGIRKPVTGGGSYFQVPGVATRYETFGGKFNCVACNRNTRVKKEVQLKQIDAHATMILDLWRNYHGSVPKMPTRPVDDYEPVNNFRPTQIKDTHQQTPFNSKPTQFQDPYARPQRPEVKQPVYHKPEVKQPVQGSGLKSCSAPPTKNKIGSAALCKLTNNDAKHEQCEATVSCNGDERKVTINAGFDLTSIRGCSNCEVKSR